MAKILGTLLTVVLGLLVLGYLLLEHQQGKIEKLEKIVDKYRTEVAVLTTTVATQEELCAQKVKVVKIEKESTEEIDEVFENIEEKKKFRFTAKDAKDDVLSIMVNGKAITLKRESPLGNQCLYDGNSWLWINSKELE